MSGHRAKWSAHVANGESSSEAVADQHVREPSHESQLFLGESSRTSAHLQAAPALLAKAPELDHRNFKEEFIFGQIFCGVVGMLFHTETARNGEGTA